MRTWCVLLHALHDSGADEEKRRTMPTWQVKSSFGAVLKASADDAEQPFLAYEDKAHIRRSNLPATFGIETPECIQEQRTMLEIPCLPAVTMKKTRHAHSFQRAGKVTLQA